MIDLHTHSIYSDGTDTPEQLALAGGALGLTALALTDHDTVEGLERFLSQQSAVRTRLVPGVELSCSYLGRSFHLLGLCFRPWDQLFQERLAGLRLRRDRRNQKMAERLSALGIHLPLEEARAFAQGGIVSRVHFAQALAARGEVSGPEEAFRRYIGDDGPAHVPFEELSPSEAAGWIRDAGGVAVAAHPGRFAGRSFRWDQAIGDLQAQGVQGLEAYYGDYGPAEQAYFLDLARRTGMLPSGGSDYHGSYKPGVALGTGRGSLKIPDSVFEALEAAAG
jgi:predicted metal-dependent phosphoesterase TrpH